jgi:hypothetical protein
MKIIKTKFLNKNKNSNRELTIVIQSVLKMNQIFKTKSIQQKIMLQTLLDQKHVGMT